MRAGRSLMNGRVTGVIDDGTEFGAMEDGCGRLRAHRAFDEDPADRLPTI
jgi:hypothetical protein